MLHKEKNFIWNFINIYGAAQDDRKNSFLIEFSALCQNSKHPLLIGGDFNILRKECEKNKPGGVTKWSFLFNAIIEHNCLIELELSSRQFT